MGKATQTIKYTRTIASKLANNPLKIISIIYCKIKDMS